MNNIPKDIKNIIYKNIINLIIIDLKLITNEIKKNNYIRCNGKILFFNIIKISGGPGGHSRLFR